MYILVIENNKEYIHTKYDKIILDNKINFVENSKIDDKLLARYDYNFKLLKNLSNFSIFSSKILYIVSLPEGMEINNFLNLIKDFDNEIEYIRFLKKYDDLENLKNNTINFFHPLIIYFKNELAADNFLNNFDCNKFENEFDPFYILKLKDVYFIEKINILDFDILNDYVEFPKCPKCLEKIETQYSEILIPETYEKISWVNSKFYCKVCYNFNQNKSTKNNCGKCDNKENLWICLICGDILCGRFSNKHSLKHYYKYNHNLVINSEYMIWCYQLDQYVHK